MDIDQWQQSGSPKVMLNALAAKFEQNDNLKACLMQIVDSQIVEDKIIDTFGSCGLSLDEPDKIKDTGRQPGKNQLGNSLMAEGNNLK